MLLKDSQCIIMVHQRDQVMTAAVTYVTFSHARERTIVNTALANDFIRFSVA
jgi:hypothetical protein